MSDLITCTHCFREMDSSYFVSFKRSRKPTKNCYFCRKKQLPKNSKEKYYVNVKSKLSPCVMCGDSDPTHLDFDHIGNKTSEVNKMTTINDIKLEIENCQSLCMKCHRKKTFQEIQKKKQKYTLNMTNQAKKRREFRQRNYEYRCKRKIDIGGCQNSHCKDVFDSDNLMFYEFDHIDRESKTRCVSKMNGSLKKVEEEIQKCRLLCGYCHRNHTREQFISARDTVLEETK